MPSLTLAAPENFTYQGQILNPEGEPLDSARVDFTVEVLSPSQGCVLYREHHTVNMRGSNGVFAIEVGSGGRAGSDFADASSLDIAISNASGNLTGLSCDAGDSYEPSYGDRRKLRITFDDGSGANTLTHNHELVSAPFAMNARTLEGHSPLDFVQVNEDGSHVLNQENLETLFTSDNFTELMALLDGSSTNFASASPTGSMDMSSQRIMNLQAPEEDGDATNKGYVDTNIAGLEIDPTSFSSVGATEAGKVLTWSGSQWQVTSPSGDPTKLPLAGGVMSGSIVMNNNNISGVGNLGVNSNLTVANDTMLVRNVTIGEDLNVNKDVLIGGGLGVSTGINSDGNISIYGPMRALQFTPEAASGSNNYVGLRAPSSLSGTQIWTLPSSDGSNGQVMMTDGAGNMSWQTVDTDQMANESVTNEKIESVHYTKVTGLGSMATENAGNYVPIVRTITAGTGLTGGGNLSGNRTINFDQSYGDGRYVNRSGDTISGNLSVSGNLNANQLRTNDVSGGGRWCRADADGRIRCNQDEPSSGNCILQSATGQTTGCPSPPPGFLSCPAGWTFAGIRSSGQCGTSSDVGWAANCIRVVCD